MKNKDLVIAIAGLPENKNYGDVAIYHCCKALAVECLGLGNPRVVSIDLQSEEARHSRRPFFLRKSIGIARRLRSLIEAAPGQYQRRALAEYYRTQLNGSKILVIAGGGLIKYRYQRFWLYLDSLLTAAEHCGVPVIFNAVGVEGFDDNDPKCRVLKQALNKSVVKAITTRDDLETLKVSYLNKKNTVFVDRVADPAVWSAEVYGVNRNANSDVVGVGLVRGGIFRDNGIDLSPEDVVALYRGLVGELDSRGIKWQLFTTGLGLDLDIAGRLVGAIPGLVSPEEIAVPRDAAHLIQIISGFRGVVAARLHANILSYSLGIPSVGLVWNDKLKLFGDQIGYPERFVERDLFGRPDVVVDRLINAMDEGYEVKSRDAYRDTAKSGLRRSLQAVELASL